MLFLKKTWFGALHACHFMGLELASITSKEDEENLAQVIKDECEFETYCNMCMRLNDFFVIVTRHSFIK